MARLLKSTVTVGGMTLASRVLGFVRDVVIARIFGAGPLTDAFFVALRIPNMLRRWFAEGAFSMAFVPVLGEYRKAGNPNETRALLGAVAGTLGIVVSVIVATGMIFAPALVYVFAPGLTENPELFELTAQMLRITFPYALFIALAAMAAGVLNTWGHFAMPAFSPVILNLLMIAGGLFAAPWFAEPILALAWAVALAGVAQLALQLPVLWRLGLIPRLRVAPREAGVKRIMRLMGPALFGSSVQQINILVDTFLASMIGAGAISWLYYSDRLLEFPLGVFGIAISTVVLPALSAKHAESDRTGFSETVDWGLRTGLLISIPSAIGLIVLAYPINVTLFQYGQFTAADAAMCAASLTAYALGLPAFVAVKTLIAAFYSRQDARTPVRVAVKAVLTNIVLNLIFLWCFDRFTDWPLHVALALASSCSAYLNATLLYVALRRDGLHGSGLAQWAIDAAKAALAIAAMGSVLWWFRTDPGVWTDRSLSARAGNLAIVIVIAAFAYGAVLTAIRQIGMRARRSR